MSRTGKKEVDYLSGKRAEFSIRMLRMIKENPGIYKAELTRKLDHRSPKSPSIKRRIAAFLDKHYIKREDGINADNHPVKKLYIEAAGREWLENVEKAL